jgi:hypothetical protein
MGKLSLRSPISPFSPFNLFNLLNLFHLFSPVFKVLLPFFFHLTNRTNTNFRLQEEKWTNGVEKTAIRFALDFL